MKLLFLEQDASDERKLMCKVSVQCNRFYVTKTPLTSTHCDIQKVDDKINEDHFAGL